MTDEFFRIHRTSPMRHSGVKMRKSYELPYTFRLALQQHHDAGDTVLVRTLELKHNITASVEFEPFISNGGAGVVTTQGL